MPIETPAARCEPVVLFAQTDDLQAALATVIEAFSAVPGVDEAYHRAIAHLLHHEIELSHHMLESGVAVVHGRVGTPGPPVAALVRLADVSAARTDDGDSILFAWVLFSNDPTHPRISFAAEFAKLMHVPSFAEAALNAPTPGALLRVYEEALSRKVGLQDTPTGLRFTRRPFGGLIEDLKRRLPWWIEDFRAGLSTKVFGSTLFMYFACLAPAVAFGGLLTELTGGNIGAVETLVASAVAGLLWATFSGQPLAIVGATGPNVIFTGILYGLCVA